MAHRFSKRGPETIGALTAFGFLAIMVVEPAAAQPGGGQFDTAMTEFIPWLIRWGIVIGALVGAIAHLYSGWTSDPDKAFRRKEWRNRAWGAVAVVIPALIVINWFITTFGGEPLDFFPFV